MIKKERLSIMTVFLFYGREKLLPAWYAGGIGNNRNALCGVGQLSDAGFIFCLTKRL
jgi:hypothetical protein